MKSTRFQTSQINPLGIGLAMTAGLALLLAAPKPAAAQNYGITDLGSFGGDTFANGLSANGTATGYSNNADNTISRAFLTAPDGPIQDLGTLGGDNSIGQAITTGTLTQVVGYSDIAGDMTHHAFLWTAGGVGGAAGNPQMRDLGTLSGNNADYSQANGINSLGQVVGFSTNSNGVYHAFRTTPDAAINGATDDLGTLGGGFSSASGINTLGQVVGDAFTSNGDDHAFRSTPTGVPVALTDLGTLGGSFSSAQAINASGQVVGQSSLAADGAGNIAKHAFLWTQGATNGVPGNMQMTDLGSLGGDSTATSINDMGTIVGFSLLSDGATSDAFLYSNGKMVDLNTLLAPNSDWMLQDATSINNAGQIAGYGLFTDAMGNQTTRAFLLNAAPEPSSLCVLAIGLGTLGLLAARKRRSASSC